MKKKIETIEVAGVLVPADPEEIARILNSRYPNIRNAITPLEIERAIEDGTIPVSGGMVEDASLWTFVDTVCDCKGLRGVMKWPKYKEMYGEVNNSNYPKHKKQVLRLSKKPGFPLFRPFRSWLSFSGSGDHFLKTYVAARHKKRMKNLGITWTDCT